MDPTLERLGHTLEEVTEDVITEPLPLTMMEVAAKLRNQHDADVPCLLMDAISKPAETRIVERGGELFTLRSR
jgi:hypothetical protein